MHTSRLLHFEPGHFMGSISLMRTTIPDRLKNIKHKKQETNAYNKNKVELRRNRPFTNIFIMALKVDPCSNTDWMIEALQELKVWNNIF